MKKKSLYSKVLAAVRPASRGVREKAAKSTSPFSRVCTVTVCLILTLTMILSGCGKNAFHESAGLEKEETGSRLQVVTTIFPQYDFARQIAGDCADVYMLLKPGEEIHSYEPTPQDIQMIQNSDLFIYTGGENDVWVENILASLGEEKSGPHAVRDRKSVV